MIQYGNHIGPEALSFQQGDPVAEIGGGSLIQQGW